LRAASASAACFARSAARVSSCALVLSISSWCCLLRSATVWSRDEVVTQPAQARAASSRRSRVLGIVRPRVGGARSLERNAPHGVGKTAQRHVFTASESPRPALPRPARSRPPERAGSPPDALRRGSRRNIPAGRAPPPRAARGPTRPPCAIAEPTVPPTTLLRRAAPPTG